MSERHVFKEKEKLQLRADAVLQRWRDLQNGWKHWNRNYHQCFLCQAISSGKLGNTFAFQHERALYITKMTREKIIMLVLAFPDLLLRNNYSWHALLFWFYCMNQIWVSIFNGCVWLLFVLLPNDTGAGVFLLKGYTCWCSDSLYNQSFYHLLSLTLFSWATCHFRGFSAGQYFKSCLHQSWAKASQNVCKRWIYDGVQEKLNKCKKGWKVLAKLFPVLGVITEWLWLLSSYKLSTLQKWDSIIWIEVGFTFKWEYDQIFLSSPVWILYIL